VDIKKLYNERNDRINRLLGFNLDSSVKRIGVVITKDADFSYSDQVMAIMTLNILARWCQKIVIDVDESIVCKINGCGNLTLKSYFQEKLQRIDSFGEFEFNNCQNWNCDIILMIGNNSVLTQNCYWVNSCGWLAGHGFGIPQTVDKTQKDDNIVGAAYAACLANAMVFNDYIDSSVSTPFKKWYSLFDFTSSSAPNYANNQKLPHEINFGKIWQIGCGAVGSSFDSLLSFAKVSGEILLIDFDIVTTPNISSSILFEENHATNSIKKIDVAESCIRNNQNFSIGKFDGDYGEFISSGGQEVGYPDLILCFANERNIWSTIQNNYPPLVLHATTTENWGINFGRHLPNTEWCIVCRFGQQIYSTTPVCSGSTFKISESNEEKFGVLPFLSPAAAVITLSEIIKLNLGDNKCSRENFLQFSFKDFQNSTFQRIFRSANPDCPVCSSQSDKVYALYLDKSKYSKLEVITSN